MSLVANNLSVEIPLAAWRRRLWQIIPGVLSWGTLIALAALSFILPFWIAVFVIAYDLYALIRAVYMSIHLLYAYRRLRREKNIDWIKRCQKISGDLTEYEAEIAAELKLAQQEKNNRQIPPLKNHLAEVKGYRRGRRQIYDWQKVEHAIILPTYDESLAVLRMSLDSLAAADFPRERLHVAVGFEARAGQAARDRAQILSAEYRGKFGTFVTSFHPENLPGEARVKSANAAWAIRELEKELARKKINVEQVVVSNFDSDTVVSRSYFAYLTYAFITHPDRYHASYQPLPMYNNNVWDAPAFSRVIATGSTFWQMIESTRPERLVTFSSHSMTLQALRDVGYWQRDIVSEDSRIFWQCLIHYHGRYQTYPLYTTVSMDAALADTWWQTFINQYKQKRRWAWGIENFVFMAEGFLKDKKIPWPVKWTYLWRTLEGHHSWATTPIIIAGLGWLPVLFGGPEFNATVLSYTLPSMARTIMSVAMLGLIVSTALSLLLLPPRPEKYRRWRYLTMVMQWALVPVIATVLSAFPALDSETRLMLGRDLSFNVMVKARKNNQ